MDAAPKIHISIRVIPPADIIISKSSIDFGTLDPCTSAKDDSLTITNSGISTISIEKNTIMFPGLIIVSPTLPFYLKPGEIKTIIVRYNAVTSSKIRRYNRTAWKSLVLG